MHWLWSPLGLLSAVPIPAFLASTFLTPSSYPILFGQPYFLTPEVKWAAAIYLLIYALVFALGLRSGAESRRAMVLDIPAQAWLRQSITLLSIVTYAAYAAWAGLAVARGLRVNTIAALIAGDPGTMYVLRGQYFETLGGVTTWMQLGAILAPLLVLQGRIQNKLPIRPLVLLFVLAATRALLNSERLALIEIGLSTGLALLILRPAAPRLVRNPLNAFAIIAAAWVALIATFSAFEYFRSWSTVRNSFPGSFLEYSTSLLTGYYATAINLGAFDIGILKGRPTLVTLFDGSIYTQIFGPSPVAGVQKAYGLETFTNRSGLVVPMTALGIVGGAILVLVVALILANWARRAAAGHVLSFALYCACAVGILELVRIFYFGSSRFLPITVFAVLLWISWHLSRRRSAVGKGAHRNVRLNS